MTTATLAIFVFATIGVKVVLGLAAIWLLLPHGGRCDACDEQTLPVAGSGAVEWLLQLARVQRRFCVGCGRTELARRAKGGRLYVGERRAAGPAGAPVHG